MCFRHLHSHLKGRFEGTCMNNFFHLAWSVFWLKAPDPTLCGPDYGIWIKRFLVINKLASLKAKLIQKLRPTDRVSDSREWRVELEILWLLWFTFFHRMQIQITQIQARAIIQVQIQITQIQIRQSCSSHIAYAAAPPREGDKYQKRTCAFCANDPHAKK